MHPRQTIRERIFVELTNHMPGVNVFMSLKRPLEQQDKPAVLVRGFSESVQIGSMRDLSQERTYQIQVAVFAESENEADDLAKMVEIALANPQSLKLLQAEISLTDISINQEQNEHRDCSVIMGYTVIYSATGNVLSLVS